jgi:predicted TIM-barrel fold metal-dependent hydrolase
MKAEVPLVDTHFHVYTRDMPQDGDAWHSPPEDASIERMVKTLDEHGVTFGVMAAASIYGDYNDYTGLAMRQNRKRLRGTAIVKPATDIYILRQMDADGFCGVRFQWRYIKSLPDLKSSEYRLLLKRVADLGWHVHVHADSPRVGPIVEHLEGCGVRIVVDHFGRPDAKLGVNCPGFKTILASIERGKTWVKLSAGFRMEPPALAREYAAALIKVAGGERLFWGSDWPFAAFESKMTYARAIADFAEWVPDEKLRHQIGAVSPMKFYFT